jgi:phenylpropionate dioxygenase-like ring-hydroxylating dioxygenase large terminal subunit
LPIDLGGLELVAYRTTSGRPVVLDRHCCHLGASLALGTVEGERIRCTFHRWSYDTEGKCCEIPGCQKIPPEARVRCYPIMERFGAVWVFLGDRVYYELPRHDDIFDSGHWWTTGLREVGVADTICRDIAENLFDYAHTLTVHEIEYDPASFQMTFEGHRMETSFYVNKAPLPRFIRVPLRWLGVPYKVPLRTKITGRKFGPALSFYKSEPDALFPPCINATMFQPVTSTKTRIYMCVWSKGNKAEVWKWFFCWLYHWIEKRGIVHDDLPIWNTKKVIEDPPLSSADRWPIMRFRKWWATLDELARVP